MERLASVPVSNKKILQDAVHTQLDLETASESDEKISPGLEGPKLIAASDGTSTWHASVDGKSMDMDDLDQVVGWVPQIKSKYGVNILAPKPALKKKQTQPKAQQRQQPVTMHYTMPSLSGSEGLGVSPPPSYSVANNIGGVLSRVEDVDIGGERRMDMVDVKIPVQPAEALPATPPASASQSGLDVPASVPPPPLSPARSSSPVTADATLASSQLQEHATTASAIGHVKNNSSQTSFSRSPSVSDRPELPRLMTVTNTFIPTLDDELPVKAGDTVRLLEEFKDGWCIVQYVGRFDAAKGAVPRIFLQERRSVVPARKTSTTSLSSSISGSYRR